MPSAAHLIRPPRIESGHKRRRPISESTVRRERGLLRAIFERAIEDGYDLRIRSAASSALGTGCRLDEIRGIDSRRDSDWTRGTVHVAGTLGKERDVPMQPAAKAALEERLDDEGRLWTQDPQRLREVLAEGCARRGPPAQPARPAPHVQHAVAAGRRRHL